MAILQRVPTEGVHAVDLLAVQWTVAAQGCRPADLSHAVDRRSDFEDCVGDAVLAIDLHGALIEVMSFREPRGTGMAFDEQVWHTEVRQKDRTRQAAAAAANDENGDFDVTNGHGFSFGWGFSWSVPQWDRADQDWPPPPTIVW